MPRKALFQKMKGLKSMVKKSGKMAGVHSMADSYKPESSLRLEGGHAKAVTKMSVGKKSKIVVHGTKTRHVVNSDGSHSIEMVVHNVSPFNDDKDVSGPHGKAADNDQDNGAKI